MQSLSWAIDLTQTVQKYDVGAPGCTYFDWSPNGVFQGNMTQITADISGPTNEWAYLADGFGVGITCVGGTHGDISVGQNPSCPVPPTPTTGISMSCWFRMDAAIGNYPFFLGRGPSGHCYALSANTTQVGFNVDTVTVGTSNIVVALVPPVGTWYHLGLTWDNVTILAYMNGALLATKAESRGFNNANGSRWQGPGGFSDIGNSQFNTVRYAMVWTDRILTPQDMWELYANPSPFQEGFLDADITITPPTGGGGGGASAGGNTVRPILGLTPGGLQAVDNVYLQRVLGA